MLYLGYNDSRSDDNTGAFTAVITVTSCDLRVSSLGGTSTMINPDTGGDVTITGTIASSSEEPVTWTLNILDRTLQGSGKDVSATWDGKYADGTVVEPGSYSATLTAQSAGGKCSDSKTVKITVMPPPDGQCGLYVQFGSQAHMGSGNLSQSQEFFSTKGGALPVGFALYYNSLDPHSGSLGRGWSHSYDSTIKENSDGSVLITGGNWKYQYFTLSNGKYIGKSGDYSTLLKNAAGSFTLTTKEGTVYIFGSTGTLTSITDRNGNSQTLTYDNGNLSAVADSSGRVIRFSYENTNHLISVTDPSGRIYNLSVGAALTSVAEPDGATWHYTYDSNGYLITKTDPLGNTTTYAYDDKHRVISATDPEGKTRGVAYQTGAATATVRSTTFTEKDGGLWQYAYDTLAGTLTSKTDPQGGVTSYTYDAAGNNTSTTFPDGTITSSTYDSKGNVTSITDALGQTTNYTYNAFAQILTIQDPQGHMTGYAYDDNGNLVSVTDPTGAVTRYQYDSRGNVTQLINAVEQTITFAYDAAGNLTSVTDPTGAATSYSYDTAGNMTSQTDPSGAVTRFTYDARNRIVAVTDPMGNTTAYAYDRGGNRTSTTDANGRTTTSQYNYQGQLIKTTDALGSATTYAYGGAVCPSCGGGAVDKLTSVTDANGNATAYRYDELGRVVSETGPLGYKTTYMYDAKGNVVAKADPNGSTIKFSYDGVGRLLKKIYPDGTSTTFTYDAKGNMLTASNADTSYAFTYDAAGRPLSVTDASGKAIQYSYDVAGRKAMTFYPEGSVVSYGYDAAGRLSSIMNGGGRIYSYTYDGTGRRSSLILPNGVKTSYSYDPAGRLTELTHKTTSGDTIASFRYGLDRVGNRLSKTTPDWTISYLYDPVYRLTQALSSTPGYSGNSTGKGGGIPNATRQQREFYTYDPVGNRLTSDRNAVYAYNEGNELISDGGTYAYDKNGNLIRKVASDGMTIYSWDYEKRLVKVAGPGGTVIEFGYDPFGRRISKKVTQGAARTVLTRYFYDDNNLILEYDAAGLVVSKYVHGPDIDEPVAVTNNKGTYFYHMDGLGSVIALTDQRGNIVQTYEYDSFGNLKDQKNRIKQAFSYTGREWDKETGLYYNRERYYDPMEGRFISKDPIGFAGGDVNLFAYVQNNPINLTDLFGLASDPTKTREQSRACNSTEMAECQQMCGAKGVQSCRMRLATYPRVINGEVSPVRPVQTKQMSCSCNDPDDECPLTHRIPQGAAAAAAAAAAAGAFGSSGGCFVEDTLVQAKDGLKKIQDVEIGDFVLSLNEETKQNEYKRVVGVVKAIRSDMVVFTIGTQAPITVSPNHKMFVVGKGWVNAADMSNDSVLVDSNGREQKISDVKKVILPSEVKVYNFEVEHNHNYYVGNLGVLTHNQGLLKSPY